MVNTTGYVQHHNSTKNKLIKQSTIKPISVKEKS